LGRSDPAILPSNDPNIYPAGGADGIASTGSGSNDPRIQQSEAARSNAQRDIDVMLRNQQDEINGMLPGPSVGEVWAANHPLVIPPMSDDIEVNPFAPFVTPPPRGIHGGPRQPAPRPRVDPNLGLGQDIS